MTKFVETSGPFGHSRIITVQRETEPEDWQPKVVRPEGHATGRSANNQISTIVEETWECSMGRLRKVRS